LLSNKMQSLRSLHYKCKNNIDKSQKHSLQAAEEQLEVS
jgi:hypothetical protein